MKSIEIPLNDFCVKLYMEKLDGEINTMLIFRKTLIKILNDPTSDKLTANLDQNIGKKFIIEYNKQEDKDCIIIEKINIVK